LGRSVIATVYPEVYPSDMPPLLARLEPSHEYIRPENPSKIPPKHHRKRLKNISQVTLGLQTLSHTHTEREKALLCTMVHDQRRKKKSLVMRVCHGRMPVYYSACNRSYNHRCTISPPPKCNKPDFALIPSMEPPFPSLQLLLSQPSLTAVTTVATSRNS
jgi:hypothetical protein